MNRRYIFLPDDLWKRIQQAAANEGAKRGKPVSASEWIREACEERMGESDE